MVIVKEASVSQMQSQIGERQVRGLTLICTGGVFYG